MYQGDNTNCNDVTCDQPGACCLPDGSCVQSGVLGGDDCIAQGGIYQGDNTNCATVNCPGACCLDDGSCVQATQAECDTQGGAYQGDNTRCADVTCPQPGACCLPDGSCVQSGTIGSSECDALGGIYQGDNTTCNDVTCDQPGACCFPDGTCRQEAMLGGDQCATDGGIYQGDNTSCNDVVCPQPGACCLPDGSCVQAGELGGASCDAQGGVYQGDDTNCNDVTCDQPGACCLPNGDCVQSGTLGSSECDALGGVYQGDNTDCGTVTCDQPGACCLPDGSCVQADELGGASCDAQGGVYQGDDSNCNDVTCDQPGACCLPDGSCVQAGELGGADCVSQGGEYQGDNTNCADVVCATGGCCLTDGTCANDVTPMACADQGGFYLGDDVPCTPVNGPNGIGRWRLGNHPDAAQNPPPYGLRLDELFDVTTGTDVFTFDFEAPGAAMFLDYDGTSVRIFGTAFGGRDAGTDYDPAWTSQITVDVVYPVVSTAPGDDDLLVVGTGVGIGTVVWEADGTTRMLFAQENAQGFVFRFGNEDDDQGHRDFLGNSGWGWFEYDPMHPQPGTRDWIFIARDICGDDAIGACCLDDNSCIVAEEADCVAMGGEYNGDGTTCADVDCCPEPLTVDWPIENCLAFGDADSYDEFTPVVNGFCVLSASNAEGGTNHSCTVDRFGNLSSAVCVDADEQDHFDPGDADSVLLTVNVAGPASLTEFSFWQAAPLEWVNVTQDGNGTTTGPNNPPQLFAVRILRDGTEVFRQEDIPTTEDWTQAVFNLSGADFQIADGNTATYVIELQSYKELNNNGSLDAWELDDIRLEGCCEGDEPVVGACCLDDGSCVIRTSAECTALGGEYQGDGTECTPNLAINMTAPPSDPCVDGFDTSRSFWFESDFDPTDSGASKYYWDPSGDFIEYGDGTALLTGRIVDTLDSSKIFDVVVTLAQRVVPGDANYPPAGSPKLSNDHDCYVNDGGPVDPNTWIYYETFEGTLVGAGSMAGAEISLTRTGEAFQLGLGASLKNGQMGASSWFSYTIDHQPSNGPHLGGDRGDINTDLGLCVEVGACCYNNGLCTVTDEWQCVDVLNGTYQGDGTTCAGSNCAPPPPTGACCLDDGTCVETTHPDCNNQSGHYQGDHTQCSHVNCPQPSPCGPGAGDCYSTNHTPGCEDTDCCETVCALDPYCCDVEWDHYCVNLANHNCTPPTPPCSPIVEDFENGDGGFYCVAATSCGVEDGAGNPGDSYGACDSNGISGVFAGSAWRGDLRAYDGGQFCIDILLFDGDNYVQEETGIIELHTPIGVITADFIPAYSPTPFVYETWCGTFNAAAFGVSQSQFEQALSNVSHFGIVIEPDWTCWCIDNVTLTCP